MIALVHNFALLMFFQPMSRKHHLNLTQKSIKVEFLKNDEIYDIPQ